MTKYTRSWMAPLAMSLALVAGACKDKDDAETLAQDSAMARDLALAGQDSTAQPQLSDVPATSGATPATTTKSAGGTVVPPRSTTTRPRTPSTTTKTPAADPTPSKTASGNTVETGTKGSEAPVRGLAAGTTLALKSNSKVCTNTHKAGDRFTAAVESSELPAGTTAVVRVTKVERSENANDPVRMAFVVEALRVNGRSYPIDASVTNATVTQVRSSTRKDDAKKVIGGAIIGAVIGQATGKDTKSTVIGGAAGAAAGTAVAMATGDYEGCINQGATINIKLNTAAQIQM
jgi:hypothetical protein